MQVYENELLAYYFRPAGTGQVDLIEAIGRDESANLREALAHVLLSESEQGDDLVDHVIEELGETRSYKSILLDRGGYSGRRWILSFSFKEAFSESALPLLGVLIAVFAGPLALATIPTALGVVRTLWLKLAVLKEPQDGNAIALLDAMARVQAARRANGDDGSPVWLAIVEASGLDHAGAITALKVLRSKSVVEIAEWGSQSEDLDDPDNRWSVKL